MRSFATAQDTSGLALVAAYASAFDPAVAAPAPPASRVHGAEARLRAEIASLEAATSRLEPEVVAALAALEAISERRAGLEHQKAVARAALEESGATVLVSHERTVNATLARMRAGFRIRRLERTFAGGNPSVLYELVLDGARVPLGSGRTSLDTRSFGNTLGAGDRSALAAAFFFSTLAHDPHSANTVVVLDDPFVSLDLARAAALCALIAEWASRVAQIIVMSQDSRPLRLLATACRAAVPVAAFRLQTEVNQSRFQPWSPDAATPRSGTVPAKATHSLANGYCTGPGPLTSLTAAEDLEGIER